jgi:hypothetical protein
MHWDLGNDLIRGEVDPGNRAALSSLNTHPCGARAHRDAAGPAAPSLLDERDLGGDQGVSGQ